MQSDIAPAQIAKQSSDRLRAIYVERLAEMAGSRPWDVDAIRSLALAVKIVDHVAADLNSAIIGGVVDDKAAERVARMSDKRPSWVERVGAVFPS